MTNEHDSKALYDSEGFLTWSRLRRELFQSELLAPTDVDPKDIQFSRRLTVYRLMLILMIFSVGMVSLEGLLIGHFSTALVVVALAVELSLIGTFYRIVSSSQILLPPIIALGLNIWVVLWAVAAGSDHQALWFFPLVIAISGLLPTGIAFVGGLLLMIALFWVHGWSEGPREMAQQGALIATWLISLSVMRLMTRQSDELADLALTDPLTGAYNRRYLIPQAQRNLADFQRYARLSSLVMIDIDHFKLINDQYGHAEGDRVLQAMVKLIDDRIRGVDMLFRLGGEEFVILLSEVGNQTAKKIGDELRMAIARLNVLPDRHFTVSVGVCDVTQVDSAEDWLKKVDEAMYAAKQQGRDRVCAIENVGAATSLISSTLPIWR